MLSLIAYSLVIVALFQNESFFLKEWIDYHKKLGVEHFYLFDHQSQEDSKALLEPYILEGVVDLYSWDVEANTQIEFVEKVQIPIYKKGLELAKNEAKWAAFIDLDEFIVLKGEGDISSFLEEFRSFGGICLNWQVFGTSNKETLYPQESILENLVYKCKESNPINGWVKWIVQPKAVEKMVSAHELRFFPGAYGVNTNKELVMENSSTQPIVVDKMALHHYWFGTKNWFICNKNPRRKKWGLEMDEEAFEYLLAPFNEVKDESAKHLYSKLTLNHSTSG